jgi:hypothetical protein
MKGVIQNFDQKAKGNRVMENIGTDDRIILRWILKKQSVRVWTGFIWLHLTQSNDELL